MKRISSIFMQKNKGFTLIELLIVIAVLGILIVAILSAINPLEQIRKARDAGRKSDAAELLSAYERYFATFECYPWENGATPCDNEPMVRAVAGDNPDFLDPLMDSDLLTQGELKTQFPNRDSITNGLLWVSEDATRNAIICYEPESQSGRQGGYGGIAEDRVGTLDTGIADCLTATYDGTGAGACFVCVPQ